MRKFAGIVESLTPPPSNCVWVKGDSLLTCTNGTWNPIVDEEEKKEIYNKLDSKQPKYKDVTYVAEKDINAEDLHSYENGTIDLNGYSLTFDSTVTRDYFSFTRYKNGSIYIKEGAFPHPVPVLNLKCFNCTVDIRIPKGEGLNLTALMGENLKLKIYYYKGDEEVLLRKYMSSPSFRFNVNQGFIDSSIHDNYFTEDSVDSPNYATNPPTTKAVKKALDGKAANTTFTATANGLVPKADTTAEKSTAVLTAEGKWMSSYDASKSRTKRTFLAAPIDADGKADFRTIAAEDLPDDIKVSVLDLMSYGISWKPNVADPVVTRVGNMSYHKTLPIQNNMRGCIAQMKDGAKIMYFLDPTDWRWRENPRGSVLKDQALTVTASTYTITNAVFSTFQYEGQWLKINDIPCQVLVIDTSTNTATIKPDSPIDAGNYDVELGAVLNGYDGEVMVLVPEFWIKSWDTATQREVRISPSKIDDTWEHQPKLLVAAYHDTVLNTIPENMGYLSTLEANSALSVMNTNSYCRGGNNSSTYDAYITSDRFRSMLGKPRTGISRATMRANARRSGKEILSYLQYKRILYWLYFIEYANFNCQATFNAALTSEGYKQGGLGTGVTTVNGNNWNLYNGYNPLTPNGYTNEFGNGTNIKAMTMVMPTVSGGEPTSSTTQYVPRWHGIENPFGDIWNNVDGIIINSSSIVENGKNYSEVYATDDTSLYNDSDYKSMRVVGIELNEVGYTKEWDLGDTAEIVPRLNGGNTTQYKCDYHGANNATGLRTLLLGGRAINGGYAGLGLFDSHHGVGSAFAYIGFRSSCVVA